MDRLTMPDEPIDGGMRRAVVDCRAVRERAMTIYWRLKAYEDTGLTPEEIMDGKMLTGWIPVDEQLPREDKMILVTCHTKKGALSVNRAYYSNGFWHGSGSMSGVIAWMPLPEPYRP